MLIRNPVAKNMHKSARASVIISKRRSLQSDATLRDAREDAQNELVDRESLCFDDDLQGCMNCVGYSNIEIDCEED